MEPGVTCEHCGGQTPLPDDLRVPTFACRFCRRQLETARYAGESAQVDHQMAFHEEAMDNLFNPFWRPSVPYPWAKVMADVERPCKRCGRPVSMSLMFLDASANCTHCGLTATISDYLTEAQQTALRDQHFRRDQEALQDVRTRGVDCQTCGGNNPAPDVATGQSICEHCGAVLLLGDYLPEHVVARARRDQRLFGRVWRDGARSCAGALFALTCVALLLAAVIGGLILTLTVIFAD